MNGARIFRAIAIVAACLAPVTIQGQQIASAPGPSVDNPAALRRILLALKDEITAAQRDRDRLLAEIEDASARLQKLGRDMAAMGQSKAADTARLSELHAALRAMEDKIAKAEDELRAAGEQAEQARMARQAALAEADAARAEAQETSLAIQARRDEIAALADQTVSARAELHRTKSELEDLEFDRQLAVERAAKALAQLNVVLAELKAQETRRRELAEGLAALERRSAMARAEAAELDVQAQMLRDEIGRLAASISECTAARDACTMGANLTEQ
ncbi:hypothetical protein LV82_01203 [Albidovulum inexpectatum]|uniref:Uncharacterized protein n=1 Tax=Albidovulum inexpectatum TaxID=196587 RepID=A0A2S5JIG3_9RHOB|nr:hypothetical protein [Albidovulum inexpectatum]PPB81161.1 hypothetical protein LV82_01203 [Albidovulum inexpectatum]